MKRTVMALLCALVLCLTGCSQKAQQPYIPKLTYLDTDIDTVLVTDFGEQQYCQEMRILPASVLDRYLDDGGQFSEVERRQRHGRSAANRWYWYYEGEDVRFQAIQESRSGERYHYSVERDAWKTAEIGGYTVYYITGVRSTNVLGQSYTGHAYWLEDKWLTMVDGNFIESELLAVVEDILS